MTDTPTRPAGPARAAQAKPQRKPAAPAELLPGDIKTRPLEDIRLARPQMHPIQRRPAAEPD